MFAIAVALGMVGWVETPTAKIVNAADAFIDTLTADQRKREVFAFTDDAQRRRWSNLPVTMVPRAGLSLADLIPGQRDAAMNLLKAALSAKGYQKVLEIMQGDEMLKTGGGNSMFGRDLYYISMLGTPSEKSPWMLQFGGHHLAINLTVDGAHGTLTPTLTGAQPSLYTWQGKTVRPLGEESDKGMAFLNSLTEDQRKKAILSFRVADLVLGPGEDGKTIVPEGLKGSAMTAKQKAALLDLIHAWAGIVHDAAAAARMKEIAAGIEDTWFSWSGPTTVEPGKNIAAYYRIQGPKVVIEYAPQRNNADPTIHVHTMYRDPTNDYGFGVIHKK